MYNFGFCYIYGKGAYIDKNKAFWITTFKKNQQKVKIQMEWLSKSSKNQIP